MKGAAPQSRGGAAPESSRPIFVGGAERSGKTLVRWMLCSLPDVVVTRRTDMWPRFYGRYGDLGRAENLDRCLRAMLARKQIAALSPDAERIRDAFATGPATYARLFATINHQHAARGGKSRWGDQTGLVERFGDTILAAYPEAKIVQMVRDPRDCYHAALERGPRPRGAVGATVARWRASARLAQRGPRRYPDRWMVVRYESLVTDPEATMRRVCSFLGEEFTASMLLLEGVERYEDERRAAGGGTPISAARVGAFEEALERWEVEFIERFAGREMRAFGYDPRERRARRHRLASGATAWAFALARMEGRRLADLLDARRLPAGARTAP